MNQSCEPTQVSAGDTLKWTRSFSSYPASAGWVLSYALRNATAAPIDFTATADGDSFSVNVPSGDTEDWAVGDYSWSAYVTLSGERYTAATGKIKVLPDLSVADPVDARSYNEKTLDMIRAAIQGSSSATVQEYTIADRSIKYMTQSDLRAQEQHFALLVARERGLMPNAYRTRFRRVS